MKIVLKKSVIKLIFIAIIIFFAKPIEAQIKETPYAIKYSNSKVMNDVTSCTITESFVQKKKWKPNRKLKKLKKKSICEYFYKNFMISEIKKYIVNGKRIQLKSTFDYNKYGDITRNVNINSLILYDTIKIENIYNNVGNLDSILYYKAKKCYTKKVILYNSDKSIQSEFIHLFSDRKGYLLTEIKYEYENGLLNKKLHFQQNNENPIVELQYEYNDKGLITKVANKYPSLAFPEEILYYYDDQLNITKEIINYGKYGKDTFEYEYENDKFGNWVDQTKILNGRFNSAFERKITYN